MDATYRAPHFDAAAVLNQLREADRLLAGVRQTEAWDVVNAASDRAAMTGVAGAALGATAGPIVSPQAARELEEAIALIREAARAMEQHPAAKTLEQAAAASGHSLTLRAQTLMGVLRHVEHALRRDYQLGHIPPLTDWSARDADDHEAMMAAGLSPVRRALTIAGVVLAFIGFYVWVFWPRD